MFRRIPSSLRPTALLLAIALPTFAQQPSPLPPPPTTYADFAVPASPQSPGLFSAESLIPAPAAKNGPVTIKNAHFYTGQDRLRLWGVNFTFNNCFPTHAQADATAQRLRRFGINAVRFHHMDSAPSPRGIFTDSKLETLSNEALDRLDYFIAALKNNGVYTDLNLHVSRDWSRSHHWPNADKLDRYDKMLDVFHPDLIAANKAYARALLTHVNKYTHQPYAFEPAVALVEVNNEDSLFLWSGLQKLDDLPAPYANLLQSQWNHWLADKYPTRESLAHAWSQGVAPPGQNLIKDLHTWHVEQHDSAKMTVKLDSPTAATLTTHPDDTAWHLQFNQSPIAVKRGQFYTLNFRASSDRPTTIAVSLGMAHDPWTTFSAAAPKLTPTPTDYTFGFTAPADDPNARLSFSVGQSDNVIHLSDIQLRPGGLLALAPHEDPAKNTVARHTQGALDSPARAADWFAFLQFTDQSYFTGMLDFLHHDLGVRAPVTGTIGLGPLGTLSQSHMDFVDAHAYWDHPSFPHKPWDPSDWRITNEPMVNHPDRAPLWSLAAVRVKGKPFTVTEYNHAAPNEWAAECIPMIAAFAALQDWDAVFLFDCGHAADANQKIRGYFDIEGNPTKMPLMPVGARLFLSGAIAPLKEEITVHPDHADMLRAAPSHYHESWPYYRDTFHLTPQDLLSARSSVDFAEPPSTPLSASRSSPDARVTWTPGRFQFTDPHAAVYVGFPDRQPIPLGPVTLTSENPYLTAVLLPTDPHAILSDSPALLLATVARARNTNMHFDPTRHTLATRWGTLPVQIEPIKATLDSPYAANPLTPEGAPSTDTPSKEIGRTPALFYQLTTNR